MGGSKGNAVAAAATKALKQALRDLLLLPGADPSEAPDEQHGARPITVPPPREAPVPRPAAPVPPAPPEPAIPQPRPSPTGELLARAGATLRGAGATRAQALRVLEACFDPLVTPERFGPQGPLTAAWTAADVTAVKRGMSSFCAFMRGATADIEASGDRSGAVESAIDAVIEARESAARALVTASAARTQTKLGIPDDEIPF